MHTESIPFSVTLRPQQNGWPFANEIFKCIFIFDWNSWKFVAESSFNKSVLEQLMAWWRIGRKPLPEPMMTYSMIPSSPDIASPGHNDLICYDYYHHVSVLEVLYLLIWALCTLYNKHIYIYTNKQTAPKQSSHTNISWYILYMLPYCLYNIVAV